MWRWISKMFSYETAVEILTKLCRNAKQVVFYQICVFSYWSEISHHDKTWTQWEFHIYIFFSETIKQVSIKVSRNVEQMVLYQICVFRAISLQCIGSSLENNTWNLTCHEWSLYISHNVFWLVHVNQLVLCNHMKLQTCRECNKKIQTLPGERFQASWSLWF